MVMGGDRALSFSGGYSMWKAGILCPRDVLSQISLLSFNREGSGGWNSIESTMLPIVDDFG